MIAIKKLYLISTILLIGCSGYKTNSYCNKGLVLEDISPAKHIKGGEIAKGSELNGSDGLQLTDDYIIVSFPDRENIYSAFDLNGKFLLEFGQMGYAENEFLTCQLNKQHWGNSFVVNDVNAGQLRVVDLEKTLADRVTSVNKHIKTGAYSTNAQVLPDESILFLQQVEDNFKLIIKRQGNVKLEKDMYEPTPFPFPAYHCFSCVNSDGKILAFPMVYINQVNFYDLSTNDKYSVSLYDAPATYDNDNCHIYYCSVCSDGKYIYALFMNQSLEDSFDKFQKSEIHQFDFRGNLIQTYLCNEYLIDIDVSNSGIIYGLGCNEILYKYEM